MADERLIEIPDDEMPNFTRIAEEAANGTLGSTPGGGELTLVDLSEGDPGDETPHERNRRTPVRGAISYLNMAFPMSTYLLFSAWDERQVDNLTTAEEKAKWDAEPEGSRFVRWVEEMAARDIAADELRSQDERVYWLGGLFQALTYKKLIVDTHMKDFDIEFKKNRKLWKKSSFDRHRARLGNEWSDEAIWDLIGVDIDDE